MKIYVETERIILREIVLDDASAMFEMDADPEVHTYLGKSPIRTIDQAINNIKYIRQQYVDYGIGRWAIEDKETKQFAGWSGLKFRPDDVNGHSDFYEVGYRLLRKFWGQGLATESAKASLKYAFEELHLNGVYALADVANSGSRNVLLKSGLKIAGQFEHEGIQCHWFEIRKADWKNKAF